MVYLQPAARAELPPRMSATPHKKSLTETEGARATCEDTVDDTFLGDKFPFLTCFLA